MGCGSRLVDGYFYLFMVLPPHRFGGGAAKKRRPLGRRWWPCGFLGPVGCLESIRNTEGVAWPAIWLRVGVHGTTTRKTGRHRLTGRPAAVRAVLVRKCGGPSRVKPQRNPLIVCSGVRGMRLGDCGFDRQKPPKLQGRSNAVRNFFPKQTRC